MADESSNGHGESRLDRVERILAELAEEHVLFEAEHKRLLIAQVVLTERVDQLVENSKHTDERMNALIAVVDGVVRRGGPPAQAP